MTPLFFANTHATGASELLVGFHKVGSGQPCMGWAESVDEALCYGWIDGRRTRIDDDDSYTIRFTPRKPASIWSVVNIAKMEKLRAQQDTAAWDYFQAAPSGYRKTILHWITKAKREETRSKRLTQLMQACGRQTTGLTATSAVAFFRPDGATTQTRTRMITILIYKSLQPV